jgi:hypothetical protein
VRRQGRAVRRRESGGEERRGEAALGLVSSPATPLGMQLHARLGSSDWAGPFHSIHSRFSGLLLLTRPTSSNY